jgi:glycosyltransferase involved in cell wall biosynthesis
MPPAEPAQRPPGDCLLFATADWDTPYWTNKQHTAAHLARAGWRVLYVESIGLRAPRVGSGTDLARLARRLWRGLRGPRQADSRLWVFSPLVIPFRHDHPAIRWLNQFLLGATLRRFMKRHRFDRPLVWTYHPYVLDLLDQLQAEPATATGPLVYHCVDDLSAIPGIDAEAFNREERRLLGRADHVFTTSAALQAKCAAHHPRVLDFPNVVDLDHFGQARSPGPLPAELQVIPSPRLAYVGALSDFKVDFPLLERVARSHPQWQVVLIGEEREGQADPRLASLAQLPNVHRLGHRPYQRLPDYLRGMDVGLLPTRINDYTRSMFPMKYFEYLAAGIPVVSTPLEFTRRHTQGLAIGADAGDFAQAIDAQLRRGRLTDQEVDAFVGENTWSRRLDKMLSHVAGHPQD